MRNYLVIGASSGIGKSIINALAGEGDNVIGTYNKTETISDHSNVQFIQINAMDDNHDLSHVPHRLDGIVYCPGAINLRPFHRIKPDQFQNDFDLQVIGAIKIIQAVLPNLKQSPGASIVLFSTVAVQTGFNFHSQVAVSKGAIEGLTRSLAAEFAPSIRVNCIAPSLTNTPLAKKLLNTEEKIKANSSRHPLKKIGEPEDIAAMATFLLSDKSSWITAQVLHVDGGMSKIKT